MNLKPVFVEVEIPESRYQSLRGISKAGQIPGVEYRSLRLKELASIVLGRFLDGQEDPPGWEEM